MTQSEAISLAALVISGLIGALVALSRDRVVKLEERVEKEAAFRSADALRLATLEAQVRQHADDMTKVEDTLKTVLSRLDELTKIAVRLEEKMRRFSPQPFTYAREQGDKGSPER